jgi:lipopolysaccharide export system protein LptC
MTNLDMALSASWQAATVDPDARARAFAAARRHSRLVRALRLLLPLFGIVTVAGFVVAARLAFPPGLDLDAARLSVTRNSIIMDRPHLTGFDQHHREYSIVASRAIQPLLNPGQVRLEDIEAKVQSATGAMTTITAEAGDYDHNKKTIKLLGAVAADSPDGYILRLTDADIDLSAGTLISDNPVTIGNGESRVSGNHFSVTGGGKVIVIEGNVRTLVMPPKRPPAAAAPATAAPGTE